MKNRNFRSVHRKSRNNNPLPNFWRQGNRVCIITWSSYSAELKFDGRTSFCMWQVFILTGSCQRETCSKVAVPTGRVLATNQYDGNARWTVNLVPARRTRRARAPSNSSHFEPQWQWLNKRHLLSQTGPLQTLRATPMACRSLRFPRQARLLLTPSKARAILSVHRWSRRPAQDARSAATAL